MIFYARSFLEASIGKVVRTMCERNVTFETERAYCPEKVTEKELGGGVAHLVKWCQEIWTTIYNNRAECPQWVVFHPCGLNLILNPRVYSV